jgi:hypothetical protein
MSINTPSNEPATSHAVVKPPLLTSATYDRLKAFNQFVLPACGTFYAALALIWDFPYGKQVVGSIAALTIFIGVILGWAAARYDQSEEKYDGEIVPTGNPEEPHGLILNAPLSELAQKKQIIFKTPDA